MKYENQNDAKREGATPISGLAKKKPWTDYPRLLYIAYRNTRRMN